MSAKSDNLFVDTLVPTIAALAALGIVMYLIYAWVAERSRALHEPPPAAMEQEVLERIRPIGRVAVIGEAPAPEAVVAAPAVPAEPAAPARELDGEGIYKAACTACHGLGIAGAPKTGDQVAWGARVERGMDQLVQRAIEGFQGEAGYMPPRGGHVNLTDEQVRKAVQYMVDAIEG